MKIIVIEGLDGSGKATQANKLEEFLKNTKPYSDKPVYHLSFPQYGKEQAALEEMYLQGRINKDPNKVNPYAASMTYALDRYITFQLETFEEDSWVICDRYTSSNLIHQGCKLYAIDEHGFLSEEAKCFAEWITETEHDLFKIPAPDIVLYLDISPETVIQRIESRCDNTGATADIHENLEYQKRSVNVAKRILSYAYKSVYSEVDCYYQKYAGELEDFKTINLNEDEVFAQLLKSLFLNGILYNII